MSLWTTIRDALGLTPQIIPGPPPPFSVSRRAERQLRALTDTSVRLRTEATPTGRRAVLQRVPRGEDALIVDGGEEDALAGLILEHDGEDFRLDARLEVRGAETPNPDVRLYETSRYLLQGRPFHAEAPGAPGVAGHLIGVEGVKSLLLRDHVVSIEREAGAAWSTLDDAIPRALKAWFLSGGGLLTGAETGHDDPDYNAVLRVMEETVLPFVHGHGGDIRLIDVKDGVVTVTLFGACATCPASMLTLKGGVQRQLREQLPDIVQRVEAVD